MAHQSRPPVPPTDLSLANIALAAGAIDPVFRNSPQFSDDTLDAALGRRVIVKVETVNPVRSFKGRGADFRMQFADPVEEVVCASAGNFGQAIAYAGRSRGIPVTVFTAIDANPLKLARMKAFGATVRAVGVDFEDAKEHARRFADESGRIFIEDGADAAITEGAGTIGVELLEGGAIDTLVIPVGDGALIAGVALWVKAHAPDTRIVGVSATGAPAMAHSWKTGSAQPSGPTDTIADGLAVRAPIPRAVERVCALVDDIVLVDDAALLDAMRLAASTLGLLLEPAGAAGLAAIRVHPIPGDRLATVLTGSNVSSSG